VTSAGFRRMTGACDMRNGAGIRPLSSSGVSGYGWKQPGGSPAGTVLARSPGPAGHARLGAAVAAGLADGGAAALRSKGPVSRERLSARQWARLEQELRRGPLAHGFAGDQRSTLGRIKTLIGKLFHVGYTVEGTWKLMRRHGWSAQVPVRQAMERDEDAVAVWKDQVWPDIKAPRATWAPSSASRTRQARD
jgi:transposase